MGTRILGWVRAAPSSADAESATRRALSGDRDPPTTSAIATALHRNEAGAPNYITFSPVVNEAVVKVVIAFRSTMRRKISRPGFGEVKHSHRDDLNRRRSAYGSSFNTGIAKANKLA